MKKITARLIIILALVIGVAIGISVPNPRENGVFEEENPSDAIEICVDTGLACTGEETPTEPVVEEETSILSNTGTLTSAIIQEIKADWFLRTNGNSEWLVVEYTDLQCPYCKDLHNSRNTEYLLENTLGGNADYVKKHFPKAFHTEALPAQQILECIAEQRGEDAFYSAIDAVFKSQDSVSQAVMDEVILSVGVDADEVADCLASGKYREKIFAHIGEAVGIFDAKYVPSTVIINTVNGEWISYVGNENLEKVEVELQKIM